MRCRRPRLVERGQAGMCQLCVACLILCCMYKRKDVFYLSLTTSFVCNYRCLQLTSLCSSNPARCFEPDLEWLLRTPRGWYPPPPGGPSCAPARRADPCGEPGQSCALPRGTGVRSRCAEVPRPTGARGGRAGDAGRGLG